MTIKIQSLDDLTPDQHNANEGSERGMAALEHSIQSVGFGRSILVDRNGKVIAGNKTLESAAQKGLGVRVVQTSGDTVVVHQRMDLDLDDDEHNRARSMAFADNRVAELNLAWKPIEILAAQQIDVDLAHLFNDSELNKMLKDLQPPPDAPDAQIDRADELRKKWGTKRGQVWEIGAHRLMCGDCTSEGDVAALMAGAKSEMMFTDPPYGVGYTGGHLNKRKRPKLIGDDTAAVYAAFLPVVIEVVDGPCYMWFADSKGGDVYSALLKSACDVHAVIIWHKINATYAAMGAQYKQRYEPCLYFKPKGSTLRWCGPSDECTVWEIKRNPSNELHPTEKPLALPIRALGNHSADSV